MADNPKQPYGDVAYADPGYQKDGKKRYPIDTEEHVRAAWSYINQADNASLYSPEHLKTVKAHIEFAAKKFNIEIAGSHRSATTTMVETRAAQIDNVDFGERVISVITVPYEQPTQIMYRQEVWNEVFSRTAFAGIETRSNRIPANREHNPEHLVGRVVGVNPGHEGGLLTDIKVSRTARGDETLELARDDVLSASAGFMIKDPYRDQELDRRSKMRRIHRAFLEHVAFVGVPAYPGAKVLAVRNDGHSAEAELPPLTATPRLNQYLDDPIFAWAAKKRID